MYFFLLTFDPFCAINIKISCFAYSHYHCPNCRETMRLCTQEKLNDTVVPFSTRGSLPADTCSGLHLGRHAGHNPAMISHGNPAIVGCLRVAAFLPSSRNDRYRQVEQARERRAPIYHPSKVLPWQPPATSRLTRSFNDFCFFPIPARSMIKKEEKRPNWDPFAVLSGKQRHGNRGSEHACHADQHITAGFYKRFVPDAH